MFVKVQVYCPLFFCARIILFVIGAKAFEEVKAPAAKRRRVSSKKKTEQAFDGNRCTVSSMNIS